MASTTQPQQAQQQTQQRSYREIAASQIRALSALSERVPAILSTSATAVSQLTNAPIHPPSMNLPPTTADTPALREAALSASSNEFFSLVIELRTALHEQINELEQQGVIPAEAVRYVAPEQPEQAQLQQPGLPGLGHAQVEHRDSEAKVTNGGLGDFDVGVLNARAAVRQRDDDEVLERVKTVLEGLVARTQGEDEEMAVNG